MSSLITLYEYETTPPIVLTEQEKTRLRRIHQAAGVEILRPVLLGEKVGLRAAAFVGVVRLGERTIQILPKMFRETEAETPEAQSRQAMRNLLHLLALSGMLPTHETGTTSLLRRETDWFEILTRLFVNHLREVWRRGAIRQYVSVEEELPTLRGRWRVAEQIRRPENRHRFAITNDQYTTDCPLNRVLRFVVERLWHLSRDGENRALLEEMRQNMEEVTLPLSVTRAEADLSTLNRMQRPYEPLLSLARLFLEGGSLTLAPGETSVFAFVFDMNRVFEAFVIGFLNRFRASLLPPHLQDCALLAGSEGAHRHLALSDTGTPAFRLKPDLAFQWNGMFPLLLDTKYKVLSPTEGNHGIEEADVYQMYAYARRYECPRVLMLYPQTSDTPFHHRFTAGGEVAIEAATIDLRGDLARSSEREALQNTFRALLQ